MSLAGLLQRLLLGAFVALGAGVALAESALVEASPPRLVIDGERIFLIQLPPVFEDEEVERQLATGLTTTFAFTLDGRDEAGRRLEGLARVQIRYEPWDEVYFLESFARDGSAIRERLPDAAALAEFWRAFRLAVLHQRRSKPAPKPWTVTLDVIPFSRGEQRDTRRWFSESMEREGSAEGAAGAAGERPEALGGVVNRRLATAIKRPAAHARPRRGKPPPG
ncbi:MAG: hypothetical protein AAF725_01790, partial [Acidobacteriota bacterium]